MLGLELFCLQSGKVEAQRVQVAHTRQFASAERNTARLVAIYSIVLAGWLCFPTQIRACWPKTRRNW